MGVRLLILPIAATLISATPPAGTFRGEIFDGLPPVRFQGDAKFTVHLVSDLNDYCGVPPPKMHWGGCVRGPVSNPTVYIDNSCAQSGRQARILCHELGHINGWTRRHEY